MGVALGMTSATSCDRGPAPDDAAAPPREVEDAHPMTREVGDQSSPMPGARVTLSTRAAMRRRRTRASWGHIFEWRVLMTSHDSRKSPS